MRFLTEQSALGNVSPDVAAILHSWSNLTLTQIEHGSECLVFSGATHGTKHSFSIFWNGTNIQVPSEIGREPATFSHKDIV